MAEGESQAGSVSGTELNLVTLRSRPELKPRGRRLTDGATQVPLASSLRARASKSFCKGSGRKY